MRLLKRLNTPWVHFLVLGWVLFELHRWAFPDPKPVIGPLPEARIENLRQQWSAAAGSLPDQAQLAEMVVRELDRDMLFQQALAMGFHEADPVVRQRLLRNMHFLQLAEGKSEDALYQQALDMRLHVGDEVIKRRLIQLMEQLLLSFNPPKPVTEAELQSAFKARKDELRQAPRYSIQQVFFSRDRADEVPGIIARIEDEQLSPAQALAFGSPFLGGYVFNDQTPDQLARQFGTAFVANFLRAKPEAGRWLGPIDSTYGIHYVWLDEWRDARESEFSEVSRRLERDLVSAHRTQALEAALDKVREQYEVRQ